MFLIALIIYGTIMFVVMYPLAKAELREKRKKSTGRDGGGL